MRVRVLLVTVMLAVLVAVAAAPALAEGGFPLKFVNDTGGKWSDGQVYVTGIGQTEPGKWAYLKPDGTMAPLDHTMAGAPGHLTKDGVSFANMSFTLAQASTVQIPPRVEGGRIYISLGAPMYLGISSDDKGWAGPNLANPRDPNHDTIFDWYEFTYVHGRVPFGGNTTQVDQFAIPMTARVQQQSSGFDRTDGLDPKLSRAEIFRRYRAAVPAAFDRLASPERILAPRTAPAFSRGGRDEDYLDAAIDRAWKAFHDGFELTRLHQTFTGRTVGDDLEFSQEGRHGRFTVGKPTTQDVMRCSGTLAKPGAPPEEGVMGAELCAAFNRGVGDEPRDWYKPAEYYKGSGRMNDYAGFFHSIGLHDRSYAFAYDDVNDQSSVAILPNANPPSRVTLTINW